MNFQQFKTTAQISGALSIVANLANCEKELNQTDFGLNSNISSGIKPNVEIALNSQEVKMQKDLNNILDKIFPIRETSHIHLKEIKTNYLETSDVVLFQNFEMQIDYKINKIKAIPLMLKTSSLTNENKNIAQSFLIKESQLVMEELMKLLPIKELSENKTNIEEQFKLNLQQQLDKTLGKETFKIKEAKIIELYLGQSKNVDKFLIEKLEELVEENEYKTNQTLKI